MRSKIAKPDPPRPPCGTCGEPAEHELSVEVRGLKLERSSTGRRNWTSDYRNATEIRVLLCAKCVRTHVRLTVSASTIVEKVE